MFLNKTLLCKISEHVFKTLSNSNNKKLSKQNYYLKNIKLNKNFNKINKPKILIMKKAILSKNTKSIDPIKSINFCFIRAFILNTFYIKLSVIKKIKISYLLDKKII